MNQISVSLPPKLGEHCRKKGGKKNRKRSRGGIMLCSYFHILFQEEEGGSYDCGNAKTKTKTKQKPNK